MRRFFAHGVGRATLLGLLTVLLLAPTTADAQRKRKRTKKRTPASKRLPALRTPADKKRFLEAIRRRMPTIRIGRTVRFSGRDLDQSLELSLSKPDAAYAPVVDDEKFIRRLYLDVTGDLPDAAAIRKFINDADPKKRSRLIDKLLDSKAYARKWARYWRDVVFHDSTANRRRVNPKALEDWFAGEFEKNTPWDRITAELVSAFPTRNRKKKRDYGQNLGPNNFILAYENKPVEVASQTARIFMGISIQCAQCHDHPFDRWKREQFHQLAAFFSRGKYYMTDQEDPAKKHEIQPKFLLGEKPPEGLSTHQRRVAMAAYLIYNPKNYWFARAYMNRLWNELVGDGFYSVDSLGPDAEVVHKLVVNRLGAVFRYRAFDVKWAFRTILNSRAYQRDIRSIKDDKDLFTAVRPSRMRPDQVASAVQRITGKNRNIERSLTTAFKINPSIPQRDLEGSIQQALLMMNNRGLQARLRNSQLKRRLLKTKDNEGMIEDLYLSVLARTPTSKERTRFLFYMRDVKNRSEAIDDMLWVLVNSTEFVTKR